MGAEQAKAAGHPNTGEQDVSMEDETAEPQVTDFPLAVKLAQVLSQIKSKETQAGMARGMQLRLLKGLFSKQLQFNDEESYGEDDDDPRAKIRQMV